MDYKKLANAMRRGIRGRRQVKSKFVTWASYDECTISECCALGALTIGLVEDKCDLQPVYGKAGDLRGVDIDDWIYARAQSSVATYVENPVTKDVNRMSDVIINLNDSQSWTVGEIAKWIETEPDEQPEPDDDEDDDEDDDYYDDEDEDEEEEENLDEEDFDRDREN
jgi:hypothetical protein